MSEPLRTHAGYLREAFRPAEDICADARAYLDGVQFDTLVGTGLSGALVVPLLANGLSCHFLIVRKDDGAHSMHGCEGTLGARWVFVDDLIDSGATERRVHNSVRDHAARNNHTTAYAGAYLYGSQRFEHPITWHEAPVPSWVHDMTPASTLDKL